MTTITASPRLQFNRETPWNRVSARIKDENKTNIIKSIEQAKLDWNVELDPLVTQSYAKEYINSQCTTPLQVDTNRVALRRNTDKRIIGYAADEYNPLQNIDAFKWFQPFLDSGKCILYSAGSCGAQRQKIWILAHLQTGNGMISANDNVEKFLLLSNAHTGNYTVKVGITPIRFTCSNTLSVAISGGTILKFVHNQNLSTNLAFVSDIISEADEEFNQTFEQYRLLASKPISVDILDTYVNGVLGITENNITSQKKHAKEQIIDLVETSHVDKSTKNTWWAAYNGVNAYLNHHKGREETRINSLFFGHTARQDMSALQTALAMCN